MVPPSIELAFTAVRFITWLSNHGACLPVLPGNLPAHLAHERAHLSYRDQPSFSSCALRWKGTIYTPRPVSLGVHICVWDRLTKSSWAWHLVYWVRIESFCADTLHVVFPVSPALGRPTRSIKTQISPYGSASRLHYLATSVRSNNDQCMITPFGTCGWCGASHLCPLGGTARLAPAHAFKHTCCIESAVSWHKDVAYQENFWQAEKKGEEINIELQSGIVFVHQEDRKILTAIWLMSR